MHPFGRGRVEDRISLPFPTNVEGDAGDCAGPRRLQADHLYTSLRRREEAPHEAKDYQSRSVGCVCDSESVEGQIADDMIAVDPQVQEDVFEVVRLFVGGTHTRNDEPLPPLVLNE